MHIATRRRSRAGMQGEAPAFQMHAFSSPSLQWPPATASFQMYNLLSLSPPPAPGDAMGGTTVVTATASFQMYRRRHGRHHNVHRHRLLPDVQAALPLPSSCPKRRHGRRRLQWRRKLTQSSSLTRPSLRTFSSTSCNILAGRGSS
ncbi:hypothetical protein GUJ93_ZPchr0011g27668 [Zizania palustris]|uniref:Uncharacterized protein n=1 Tax=Zizania palustris TaxID=103762 RepID=A0A8J6BKJ0_ZIZPA|nr:hypothetical protein GUJ93_ZPchr0011g27668 [Zizania palustris]